VSKLGKYINYLPYPVISGFMSGIGMIVIIMQFKNVLGVNSGAKGVVNTLMALPGMFSMIDFGAVAIFGITLVTILIIPRFNKKIPETLVGLGVGSTVPIILGLDSPVIGSLPQVLPSFVGGEIFNIPLDRISHIILPALTLGGGRDD